MLQLRCTCFVDAFGKSSFVGPTGALATEIPAHYGVCGIHFCIYIYVYTLFPTAYYSISYPIITRSTILRSEFGILTKDAITDIINRKWYE